ncbi:hypothetical protein NB037_03080 [Rathayibacter sp. ZW T2_19]|uniref:Phage tail protein n=1 Tax=Rathayibacter rubneri TaxID=2950106 RepID=A0A9X2DW95_9MICO|nr:hypothetical protein [Rathayibacter rubneri]MCM6761391.1 hypothetical protein [Rathayibacter rubneri]
MSRYYVVGTDGARWSLKRGERVAISVEGLEGLLGDPDYQDQVREYANQAGQEFVGTRALPRRISLPVKIGYDKPGREFRSLEGQWWQSWQPGSVATIEVATHNRGSRFLDVRFVSDRGWVTVQDPDVNGTALVPMELVADDPYWRGTVLDFDFTPNRPPVDFYGRDKGQVAAFPGYFSPSLTKDEQSLFNPGDVPAPLRWSLQGPFTSFELTVDGRTVAGEFVVAEGQTLSVDSGGRRVLLHDGVSSSNVTRRVSWGFADLPAGLAVPVGVLVNGTGRVRAEWTPKFRRAA